MGSPARQSPEGAILLVDDDAMLRDLMARQLADAGYAVLTAGNGEEALALANAVSVRIGLVVTDIRMPSMDGLELASRLAQLQPAPPVLFISGYVATTSVIPGPLLSKPFRPADLLKRVERMFHAAPPGTPP